MSVVISGFPAIGKSYLTQYSKYFVSDSDSSFFSKECFPSNYIDHIRVLKNAAHYDYILVSSHKEVRDELKKHMTFYLVYPDVSLKEEYIQRYINRGSPEGFVEMMKANFENFVQECEDITDPQIIKIKLTSGQTLSDVITQLT